MDKMCSLNAWGYDILIFATSFQKSSKGWPQQPPTERVSNISEKLEFWWSIVIGHLGPGMIRPLGSVNVLMNWGNWDCRGAKLRKLLLKSEELPILMFWKEINFCLNHEISCWILAPSLSEAVEANPCHFFGNWLMKLKFPILLNMLWTLIQWNYWSFYPS